MLEQSSSTPVTFATLLEVMVLAYSRGQQTKQLTPGEPEQLMLGMNLSELRSLQDLSQPKLKRRFQYYDLWQKLAKYQSVIELEQDLKVKVEKAVDTLNKSFWTEDQVISEQDITQYTELINQLESIEADYNFVMSFFYKYPSLEKILTLKSHLLTQKEKWLLNDTQIPKNTRYLIYNDKISPYFVGRILLHALLQPVTDWTKDFYDCFDNIILSLAYSSRLKDISNIGILNSYLILKQLYLKNQAKNSKINKDNASKEITRIIKDTSSSSRDFIAALIAPNYSAEIGIPPLVTTISSDFSDKNTRESKESAAPMIIKMPPDNLLNMAETVDDLIALLSSTARNLYAQILGKLSKLINTINDLIKLLKAGLYNSHEISFFSLPGLGNEKVLNLITTADDLLALNVVFGNPQVIPKFLDDQKLSSLITSVDNLVALMNVFPHSHPEILEVIDNKKLLSLITSADDLVKLFKIEPNIHSKILKALDDKKLSSLINSADDLVKLFKIELDIHLQIFEVLDKAKLSSLNFDAKQLTSVFNTSLSSPLRLKFLILLDRKDLAEQLPASTEKDTYLRYARFIRGESDTFTIAKVVLNNYIKPEGLGFIPRYWASKWDYLGKVSDILKDSQIDTTNKLMSTVLAKVDTLENIKKNDDSLYRRLQFICALENCTPENYLQISGHFGRVGLLVGKPGEAWNGYVR